VSNLVLTHVGNISFMYIKIYKELNAIKVLKNKIEFITISSWIIGIILEINMQFKDRSQFNAESQPHLKDKQASIELSCKLY